MTSPTTTDPAAVLHFWFDELSAAQHFAKDAALDAAVPVVLCEAVPEVL